jgi:hypothetical protein
MLKSSILSLALVATLGAAPSAFADGFVCETLSGDLHVRVYNKTQPSAGTRNAGVMVLSDPTVSQGRKTIATFHRTKNTLSNHSSVYESEVDLRVRESARGGEMISGTRLKHLDSIILDIEFSYADPIRLGETTTAEMTLIKRNGKKIRRNLKCVRYLKG